MRHHTEAQISGHPAHLAEGAEDHTEGLLKTANELGGQAREVANDLVATVKEHPFVTLAVAAGLAFAIGALWKIRAPARQSQLEALTARLPELPSAERLRSYWR